MSTLANSMVFRIRIKKNSSAFKATKTRMCMRNPFDKYEFTYNMSYRTF
jgi:hypothetical protein